MIYGGVGIACVRTTRPGYGNTMDEVLFKLNFKSL
jgi:hypothetical protein